MDNYFFVESDSYKDQIKQIVKHFSLNPYSRLLTRCLICNALLTDIDRALIQEKVPPYVYETQDLFKICLSCNRIFWQATHKDKMVRQLMEILS